MARTLTFASRVKKAHLQTEEALRSVGEAVNILETFPPSADLAQSLSMQAFVHWLYHEDSAAGLEIADKAASIAQATGDEHAIVTALSVKGMIVYSDGNNEGMALVEESRRRAEASGYRFAEVRALSNMTGMCGDVRDVERAADFARRARETAARYEMRMLEADAQAMYAEILQWKGDWTAAENSATDALDSSPATETLAWRVLGTVQARRGRSEARAALERMWDLAQDSDQLTIVDPAAAVLAEYMWLSDDRNEAWNASLLEILDTGLRSGPPWPSAALVFWMWKLGFVSTIPEGTANFYRWIIEGDWERAAKFWHTRGVPYERGLALMHGDDDAQVQAVRIFEELGAIAAAARVRTTLAGRGVKVPRGRSRSTQDHAAGLTARQAEVLELLADGLTNSDIADRLFVSYRTVENHVAAVLMKLDVPTRDAAVEAARGQGILTNP